MLEISTKEDAEMLLSGLAWMSSEGVATHAELAPLVTRFFAAWPALREQYDYLLD